MWWMNISTANAFPDSPQTSTTLYKIITIFISNASQKHAFKKELHLGIFILYTVCFPLMKNGYWWYWCIQQQPGGGEKRAWLPIKAICGYETIAFGSWKNWTYYYIHHLLWRTYIQINQIKIQGEIMVQTFKYLTYLTDVLALEFRILEYYFLVFY